MIILSDNGYRDKPLDVVLGKLALHRCDPRQRGANQWLSKCPAHDDRNPSLSVSEGSDGRVLLHCHAGCTTEAIVRSIGLDLKDLFPRKAGDHDPVLPGARELLDRIRQSPQVNAQPAGYGTLEALPLPADDLAQVTRLTGDYERETGAKFARAWAYHNAEGQVVQVVLRLEDSEGKKTIRPISLHGGKWVKKWLPKPRPLYNLPAILAADPTVPVFLVEGEKCAERLGKLGFLVTTSSSGAKAEQRTDWGPLSGRLVIAWPDKDKSGEDYVQNVEGILRGKAARLVTVRLADHVPNLPEGGDIADVLDKPETYRLGGLGDKALRELIAGWAAEAAQRASVPGSNGQSGKRPPKPAVPPWRPFPTDLLPSPAREYVKAAAAALKTSEAFLAPPLLTMLGSAVGNALWLRAKGTWEVPPILWTVIVGESGQGKSPAFRLVLEPIRMFQERAFEEYDRQWKEYVKEFEQYEREKDKWKRGKSSSIVPPEEPDPPPKIRYYVSDTTVEALALVLKINPRGVLLARDELAGWFGGFDRYASNKGRTSSDASHWLSLYNADTLTVDRKTGTPTTIHVPRAAVSLTGTIQPAILRRALSPENRENGLAARLLFVYPPRTPREWSKADVPRRLKDAMAGVAGQLLSLQPEPDGKSVQPVFVKLDEKAEAAFIEYFNRHNQEIVELEGDLAAAWAKLEETALRLALIVHCIRWASGDVKDHLLLDAESMRRGIALTEWFKYETARIYAILDENEEDRDQRRLAEWVAQHGGQVTVRDVMRGLRRFRDMRADDVEAALNELVAAGIGAWETIAGDKGGQPARVFVLSEEWRHNPVKSPPSGDTTPQNPSENGGCVAVSPCRHCENATHTDKTDSTSGDSREVVLGDKAGDPAPALPPAGVAAQCGPSVNPPKADGQASDSLEELPDDVSDLFEEYTPDKEWRSL
jgi:hypothetical protein